MEHGEKPTDLGYQIFRQTHGTKDQNLERSRWCGHKRMKPNSQI